VTLRAGGAAACSWLNNRAITEPAQFPARCGRPGCRSSVYGLVYVTTYARRAYYHNSSSSTATATQVMRVSTASAIADPRHKVSMHPYLNGRRATESGVPPGPRAVCPMPGPLRATPNPRGDRMAESAIAKLLTVAPDRPPPMRTEPSGFIGELVNVRAVMATGAEVARRSTDRGRDTSP
jgi:hypothetical protein